MFWASWLIICIFRLTLNGLINKSQGGSWKGNGIFHLNSSFYIHWKDVPLNEFLWLKYVFQSSWGLGMILFLSGFFQLLHTTDKSGPVLFMPQILKWRFWSGLGRKDSQKRSKILTYSCLLSGWKALLISENFTENWKEGEKQDCIVCMELFTNVSWGQNHMLGKPWRKKPWEIP